MGQLSCRQAATNERKEVHRKISSSVALGGGCFRDVQGVILEAFATMYPDAIKKIQVGFISPHIRSKPQKMYRNINDDHLRMVEAGDGSNVQVVHIDLYDPDKYFEKLIRFFYEIHDPTTKQRQGSDRGFQYSSYIFYEGNEQRNIAQRTTFELQELIDEGIIQCYEKKTVVTKITRLRHFTPAPPPSAAAVENRNKSYSSSNARKRLMKWPVEKSPERLDCCNTYYSSCDDNY